LREKIQGFRFNKISYKKKLYVRIKLRSRFGCSYPFRSSSIAAKKLGINVTVVYLIWFLSKTLIEEEKKKGKYENCLDGYGPGLELNGLN
jgi:hypothetical protein